MLWWLLPLATLVAGGGTPLNVVMIISDDLRPELAAGYGQQYMKTPNLDAFTSESMVFNRCYCQQAICGPTRNSFLSGRRPQRTQSWNFIDSFREVGPNWVAFPEYFKQANYTTLGVGKTYHPGLPPNWDEPKSWSQDKPYVNHGDGKWIKPAWLKGDSLVRPDTTPKTQLNHFTDGANYQAWQENFKYAQTKSNPFFLAYGIHKPHLPWQFPVEFWDSYGPTDNILLPTHEEGPKDMPPIAFTYELDGKTEVPILGDVYPIPYPHKNTFPDNATKAMRKGYYSAVSWVDYLVGLVMDDLKQAGRDKDTIVALIGDHGWQLGEHNIWGKHTNFELGTRVPLVVKVPGHAGARTNALVESVDLYPTIAKLAGLDFPPDVDGSDLSPLWANPSGSIKGVAFSEYPRCPKNVSQPWTDTTSCIRTKKQDFTVMGYSVRTTNWRYTVWLHWDGTKLQGDFTRPNVGLELYSHQGDGEADFNAFENVNVADDPKNAAVLQQHHALAVKQWNKA